jgi:hypothetical protein
MLTQWERTQDQAAGQISKDFLLTKEQALAMMAEGNIDADEVLKAGKNRPAVRQGGGPGMMA